ncbi:MAG: hypothetical protein E7471_06060 [Ruminococcaceae bacterium]|nr:hypothetical protein [Oscillospiraceae bacterium]
MNQKSRTIAACALFLMLGFSVFGLGRMTSSQTEEIKVMESEPIPETQPQYILKLNGEYLAVFLTNSDTPIETTHIHISSLRHIDRERLKHGISANSREDLLLLLEDYGS